MGNGGNSGDEQDTSNSRRSKKNYHRHTTQQINLLEKFFKECPHPDENQRSQLSRELGLEPKQIKFWFQNKRTQAKAQHERADNSVLKAENERIQCENLAIKEALNNVICPSCGGPPFGEEERQHSLQKLQFENAHLREEATEKVSSLLAKYIGKPISHMDPSMPLSSTLLEMSQASLMGQGYGSNPNDFDATSGTSDGTALPYQFNGVSDVEKELMMQTATPATDELTRLLRINEPLWIKAQSDGRYVIHFDSYDKIFPKANHFKSSSARIESSKDTGLVSVNALDLVDMMLDANRWVDLFPTMVTQARTLQVLEAGNLGNRSGCLLLMYGQMHILSPLVPTREFYFLRHCQRTEIGTWVIADVSYDCLKEKASPSRSWRLPSGCMIQEMPNGFSKVTWVEHVEVDDKTQTHRLFRDLICVGVAYGAERWIFTLQRMCERLAFSMIDSPAAREFGGVINSPAGKSSTMALSHKMVKNFCSMLSMSGKLDFPQLSEVNNSGIRVSVRRAALPGQPHGMIVSAASSLWLPLSPHNVFNFFRDEKNRVQWDILTNGNPVQEIGYIRSGSHPGNRISLIRVNCLSLYSDNMLILQECCIDPLGSMIIYAPIDIPTMNIALCGNETSNLPLLPSGFIISGDGRHHIGTAGASSSSNSIRVGGSLLTVAFQILVSNPSSSKEMSMECVATVNTLISSTVQRIRAALNC
ncbi:LOW QUALITY PROTEIN: Homeobox domain-containing protein/START domain-containing protein, partial [Cephalotus follicularis]